MEALRDILERTLPEPEFKRFKQKDIDNLFQKGFEDEDALKQATEHLLQQPPGAAVPPLLIKYLLQAFHPKALPQSGVSVCCVPPDAKWVDLSGVCQRNSNCFLTHFKKHAQDSSNTEDLCFLQPPEKGSLCCWGG